MPIFCLIKENTYSAKLPPAERFFALILGSGFPRQSEPEHSVHYDSGLVLTVHFKFYNSTISIISLCCRQVQIISIILPLWQFFLPFFKLDYGRFSIRLIKKSSTTHFHYIFINYYLRIVCLVDSDISTIRYLFYIIAESLSLDVQLYIAATFLSDS